MSGSNGSENACMPKIPRLHQLDAHTQLRRMQLTADYVDTHDPDQGFVWEATVPWRCLRTLLYLQLLQQGVFCAFCWLAAC